MFEIILQSARETATYNRLLKNIDRIIYVKTKFGVNIESK